MARGDYSGRVRTTRDRRGRPARRRLQPDGRGPRDRRPRAPRPHRHRLPRAAHAPHRHDGAAGEPRRRGRPGRRRPPRRRARPGRAPGAPGRRPAPALPARGRGRRAGPPRRACCARSSTSRWPRSRLPAGRARVDVDVADDLVVRADPARLRQLLVNALDNAARHAPPGTPVRVAAAQRVGDGWWLEVTDDGGGVHPPTASASSSASAPTGPAAPASGSPSPGGWPSSTAAPCASSTRPRTAAPASGSTCPPSSARPPPAPSPNPEPAMTTSTTTAPPRRRPPVPAAASPAWTPCSAGSGPRADCRRAADRRRRGGRRTASPAWPCPSPRSGITWSLVAISCGAAALLTARRRREPGRSPARLALLLVLPMTLLDAWWIVMLCMVAATAVFLCGVTGARDHPRHRAHRDLLAAGLAARPPVVRPLAAHRRHRLATPALVRTVAWSLLGLACSARSSPAPTRCSAPGSTQLVPNLTSTPRRPGLPRLLRLRRHPRRGVPRPQPRRRRGRWASGGRTRWPTGSSGWCRCWWSTLCSWPSPPPRPPPCSAAAPTSSHHRPDLRRLRPQGVRPADPRHRAHGAGRVGRVRGRAASSREDRRWLFASLGLLCVLTLRGGRRRRCGG